jgi:hypothetical protein
LFFRLFAFPEINCAFPRQVVFICSLFVGEPLWPDGLRIETFRNSFIDQHLTQPQRGGITSGKVAGLAFRRSRAGVAHGCNADRARMPKLASGSRTSPDWATSPT